MQLSRYAEALDPKKKDTQKPKNARVYASLYKYKRSKRDLISNLSTTLRKKP